MVYMWPLFVLSFKCLFKFLIEPYSATKTANGLPMVAGVLARRTYFEDVNETESVIGYPKTVRAVLSNFGVDVASMILINFAN